MAAADFDADCAVVDAASWTANAKRARTICETPCAYYDLDSDCLGNADAAAAAAAGDDDDDDDYDDDQKETGSGNHHPNWTC